MRRSLLPRSAVYVERFFLSKTHKQMDAFRFFVRMRWLSFRKNPDVWVYLRAAAGGRNAAHTRGQGVDECEREKRIGTLTAGAFYDVGSPWVVGVGRPAGKKGEGEEERGTLYEVECVDVGWVWAQEGSKRERERDGEGWGASGLELGWRWAGKSKRVGVSWKQGV